MNKQLIITLKSDLCIASGDGFSLSIDTDVCYDKNGFPSIPSRRLKGCLLDGAKIIESNKCGEIFGVSGEVKSGSLNISNAQIENFASLNAQAIKEKKKITPQQILSLYTSTKASTAIENDTAKANSLRFTRVVNHYSPFDESKELKFVADVEIDDTYVTELERICKATRNIGYKRTRGYGAVKCELSECNTNSKYVDDNFEDDKIYSIDYAIKLNSPVMISGKSSVETVDYIPGTSVLGAFAGKYLANHKADETFEELFIKGNVAFSNLYITNEKGEVAMPAPAVLGKNKGEDGIFFVTDERADKKTVKPFKSGYLYKKEERKVLTENIYHNGKKIGEDKKLLYVQNCLCENQIFAGNIVGCGKYLKSIYPLFESGKIRVGRSKTAQYSECSILCSKVNQNNDKNYKTKDNVAFKAVEKLYAVLNSDVLLLDDNAVYTTSYDDLCDEIICSLDVNSLEKDVENSSLKYKTVMGYVSVGRYKKSHERAFCSGSVAVFDVKSDLTLPKYITVGERNGEGFGVIRLCTKQECLESGKQVELDKKETETDNTLSDYVKKYMIKEKIRNSAEAVFANILSGYFNELTAAFIGRVTLMINQADSIDNLYDRIKSVKTEKHKENARKIVKYSLSELEKVADINDYWQYYMRLIFTLGKYHKKEDK